MLVTISFKVAARSSSHSAKRIVIGTRTPDMSVGNSFGRVRAIQCCGLTHIEPSSSNAVL
eukprot:5744321-Pleurochrysis_carterae.AAC.1